MALILFEGLDKSGKTFLASCAKQMFPEAILLKRQHYEPLYPVDYYESMLYDWQTLFDRLILANPDRLYIADRSFFTPMIYGVCFPTQDNYGLKPTIDERHYDRFQQYVKVMTSMPHVMVFTESRRYEYDDLVTNAELRTKMIHKYKYSFENIENMNTVIFNTDDVPLHVQLRKLKTIIEQVAEQPTDSKGFIADV